MMEYKHGARGRKVVWAFCLCVMAAWPLSAQRLTLDSCLALAQRNNADIRMAQLEQDRAQAVKSQALTKYFPQVSLGGLGYVAATPVISFGLEDVQSNDMRDLLRAIYEVFSEETDVSDRLELMKSGLSATVVAAQPLFAGGRIVNGNRLASLGREAASLKTEMTVRDVMENVESAYYLLAGLREKETTVEASLRLIDSLDRVVSAAVANGLATRSDALQVELKRREIEAMRQKLTSGTGLARRLLANMIGVEYSDSLDFSETGATTPPPLVFRRSDEGRMERPEGRLLQIGVESQRLQKKMAVGEALPQLSLLGIGYYGNVVRNYFSGNAIVGLRLSIPLTSWAETSYKMAEHEALINEALVRQKNLGEKMQLEEEKAYSDMLDAWQLMLSDSAALEVARENWRLASLNYGVGNATITEVLQAQTLMLRAENAITDRRTEYVVARRRYIDLASSVQR